MSSFNETAIAEQLGEAISEYLDEEVHHVDSFEGAGVLSSNQGLVIRMADGTEYQVTVVQSR